MKKNLLRNLAIASATTLGALAFAYAAIANRGIPGLQDTEYKKAEVRYYANKYLDNRDAIIEESKKTFDASDRAAQIRNEMSKTNNEDELKRLDLKYEAARDSLINANLNQSDYLNRAFENARRAGNDLDSLNKINAKREQMLKVPMNQRFKNNLNLIVQKVR